MMFDIYKNEKTPVNFIDIADDAEDGMKNEIIKNSNLLVIHTMLPTNEVFEMLEQLKISQETPMIILNRDVKNAFANPTTFQQNLKKSSEEAEKSNVLTIDISNLLSNKKSENQIRMICESVHEFIKTCFNKSKT